MVVIVGLGNPGAKYENTKHNIGFITVDLLAERHGIRISRLKHKALAGDGFIAGKKVMLVKPQTYMNDSGKSVRDIVGYYGVAMEDLVVVYDDVDLPVGWLRIRKKGSAGTHNGMRDIIYQLQDDGFPRFRVGIGSERGETPLYDYVLKGFEKEQLDVVRDAVVRCADAVEMMLSDGIEAAMLKYNDAAKKEVAAKKEDEPAEGPAGGDEGPEKPSLFRRKTRSIVPPGSCEGDGQPDGREDGRPDRQGEE